MTTIRRGPGSGGLPRIPTRADVPTPGSGIGLSWLFSRGRRRKEKQMEQDKRVEALLSEAGDIIEQVVALIRMKRSGQRTFAELWTPLQALIGASAEVFGGLYGAIEDPSERPAAIKAAIMVALKRKGVDLPGPDELIIGLLVDAAVFAWRALRARQAAEA